MLKKLTITSCIFILISLHGGTSLADTQEAIGLWSQAGAEGNGVAVTTWALLAALGILLFWAIGNALWAAPPGSWVKGLLELKPTHANELYLAVRPLADRPDAPSGYLRALSRRHATVFCDRPVPAGSRLGFRTAPLDEANHHSLMITGRVRKCRRLRSDPTWYVVRISLGPNPPDQDMRAFLKSLHHGQSAPA